MPLYSSIFRHRDDFIGDTRPREGRSGDAGRAIASVRARHGRPIPANRPSDVDSRLKLGVR